MRESCVVVTVLVCIATMLLQFWANLPCRRQCTVGAHVRPPPRFLDLARGLLDVDAGLGFRVQGLGSGALGRGPNRLERSYDM